MSQAAPAQEKLQRIVSDISQLTLVEVAELNKLLKTTLNIPDAPVMAYGAAPAAPSPVKEVCLYQYLARYISNMLSLKRRKKKLSLQLKCKLSLH
jgi:ribosomal protein L7/L12